jgi:hypothetical protein
MMYGKAGLKNRGLWFRQLQDPDREPRRIVAIVNAAVATGTPFGIRAMERRASRPFRTPLTGTPMTGLSVFDAMTPGRAAGKSPSQFLDPDRMHFQRFLKTGYRVIPACQRELIAILWQDHQGPMVSPG